MVECWVRSFVLIRLECLEAKPYLHTHAHTKQIWNQEIMHKLTYTFSLHWPFPFSNGFIHFLNHQTTNCSFRPLAVITANWIFFIKCSGMFLPNETQILFFFVLLFTYRIIPIIITALIDFLMLCYTTLFVYVRPLLNLTIFLQNNLFMIVLNQLSPIFFYYSLVVRRTFIELPFRIN